MKRTVGTPASLGRSGAVRKPAVSTAPEPVRMMSMKYQPQLQGAPVSFWATPFLG